jgi:putative hydrolase of the HAD superfamily
MIKALILDLDDTLYDESTYVTSGLQAVARHMAGQYAVNEDELFALMQADIAKNGRGTALNAALRSIGVADSEHVVSQLLAVYREHQPSIELYDDAKNLLQGLRSTMPSLRLGLITDGLPVMQRQKVNALCLDQIFDFICYCWEHSAPKPSVKGFERLLSELNVLPGQCVMIGDRVDHDLTPAKSLGMHTVRITRGRYTSQSSSKGVVDLSLPSLEGVLEYLKTI